jgi:serine/threonine protein kinase
MEIVEGKTLTELIGDSGLPVESVLRYGVQIAAALAHAHGRRIIHHDLKNSNVVVTPDA